MTSSETKPDGIMETVKTVVYALLIAGLFRTLFFQPFYIPSSSMKETLLIGDFMFVNKMVYGYSAASCPLNLCPFSGRILGSDPEVGDVVVFKHPSSGVDYIKRLIAVEGDKVQMKNGVLFINGTAVKTEPAGEFREPNVERGWPAMLPRCVRLEDNGETCVKERFTETLPNGVSYNTLNLGNGQGDNTPIFTVPADHFFYMGDNRDNSTDSRFGQPSGVGYAHRDLIVGRADRIIFSSSGKSLFAFWTWRSDRFFKAVN